MRNCFIFLLYQSRTKNKRYMPNFWVLCTVTPSNRGTHRVWNRKSPKMYRRHLKWFAGTFVLFIFKSFSHIVLLWHHCVYWKQNETNYCPRLTPQSHLTTFFFPLFFNGCWFSHLLRHYSGYSSLCLSVDYTQRVHIWKHLDEVSFDLACISHGFFFFYIYNFPPSSSELLQTFFFFKRCSDEETVRSNLSVSACLLCFFF